MGKTTLNLFSSTSDWDKAKLDLLPFLKDLRDQVNGSLQFDQNLKTQTVHTSFGATNTDVAVSHNLGTVPSGYILAGASAPMSLFNGSKANTASLLYLRSNNVGSATIVVF